MKFILYKARDNEWRWRLLAANNEKIADSGEGYKTKEDAIKGINLVKLTNAFTPVEER